MKLYATVTSERASEGQGGNKYLDIIITGDKKREVAQFTIVPDDDGYFLLMRMKGERVQEWRIKGEKQKDEIIEPWDIDPRDNK